MYKISVKTSSVKTFPAWLSRKFFMASTVVFGLFAVGCFDDPVASNQPLSSASSSSLMDSFSSISTNPASSANEDSSSETWSSGTGVGTSFANYDDPISSFDPNNSGYIPIKETDTLSWIYKSADTLVHDTNWGKEFSEQELPEVCRAGRDSLLADSLNSSYYAKNIWYGSSRVLYNYNQFPNYGTQLDSCCEVLEGNFHSEYMHPMNYYTKSCYFYADDAGQNCNEDSGCRYGCDYHAAISRCDTISYNVWDERNGSFSLKCPTLTPGTCRSSPKFPEVYHHGNTYYFFEIYHDIIRVEVTSNLTS